MSVLRQHVKEPDVIHPQMNIEIDLGLDSLERAEVFAALEHAFQAEFTGEQAAATITVANAVELVRTTPLGLSIESQNGSNELALATDLNWSKILSEADGDIPEVRTILRDRPFFAGFAFFVYRCFNLFCRVFMRLEVDGIETIRELKRPFLICPNHQSFLDPFVLSSNYPFHLFRNIFHVGAGMFFQGRLMSFIARMLNVVPIDQDTQLMRAMRAGAIGLKNGKVLNIYPEGERAFDGNLHEFKKGAAILATELDLPIVPVALDGLQNVWARRSSKIRPAKVKIRIGEPYYTKDIIARQRGAAAGSTTAIETTWQDSKYEQVTDHLKKQIEQMIAEMRSSSLTKD